MAEIDFKSVRSGGAFLVTGQALQAIVGFAVNLVLVRYLSPAEFGRFALILATAGLAYAFFTLRVDAMILRAPEAELDEKASEKYYAAALFETLAAAGLISVLLAQTTEFGLWELALVAALGLRHWTQQNKVFFERAMPYRKLAIMGTVVTTTAHVLALALVLGGAGWTALFCGSTFCPCPGSQAWSQLAAFPLTGSDFQISKSGNPCSVRRGGCGSIR